MALRDTVEDRARKEDEEFHCSPKVWNGKATDKGIRL